ncbi:MAG TPA: lysoplasmalogenase [Ferruginibacter sp.]|nr:lysoplasmalogenase [Ferruginibacter sp.]
MKQPVQKIWAAAFWIFAILDITGIATGTEILHFVAKPLLMPCLLLLLWYTRSVVPGKGLLLIGLFFSWMGDVFLLFEDRQPAFFMLGLASFLTTHIFYIVYFLKIRSTNTSLLKKQPVLIGLVGGYGITLVWQLYPHLGELKLPVMVYAAVICTMLLCSLHVFYKVNKSAALAYVLGAASFVLSDSLLAVNKFYQPFAYAGILIMLTYCAAQFFIVIGYINKENT